MIFGRRRLAACLQLGYETIPAVVLADLATAADRLRAERDENTCRKEMTPSELVSLGRALEELERPKAAEKQGTRTDLTSGSAEHEVPPHSDGSTRVRDLVAREVGMSSAQYGRAKHIVAAAEDPDAPPAIRKVAQEAVTEMDATGKVAPAYEKLRSAERTAAEAEAAATPGARGPYRPRKPTAERFIESLVDQMRALPVIYDAVDLVGFQVDREQYRALTKGRAIIIRICRQLRSEQETGDASRAPQALATAEPRGPEVDPELASDSEPAGAVGSNGAAETSTPVPSDTALTGLTVSNKASLGELTLTLSDARRSRDAPS